MITVLWFLGAVVVIVILAAIGFCALMHYQLKQTDLDDDNFYL